jgi:cellulose synthase/poly-beta-1,6-N-acetylglucosamine synthase-like glycosyltransferase
MSTTILEIVFWATALLLFHVYVLYPVTLVLLGSVLDRSVSRELDEDRLPTVALVIAAYNEEEVIEQKIRNSLELDYPRDKLTIIVFSDASSDRTDDIVRSYEDSGVRLERIEGRVGKTECQNRVIEQIDSEIVVFSDADSMYEPEAIRKLLEKFGPGVGCVVGELQYQQYNVEAESAYRTFEKIIKRLEPKVSSIVGGNGAIYAVRRSSYVPLPSDHISDFAEPLAVVRRGERVEYAPEARAWENTGESVGVEMSRRIRISTRSWHTFLDFTSLLNPLQNPLFSFQLASHHLIRWLSPVLLGIVAVTNVLLVFLHPGLLYRLLLLGQVLFYLLATAGGILTRFGLPRPKPVYVPYYFLVLNYSLVVALWNVIRGRNIITWETEQRTTESD